MSQVLRVTVHDAAVGRRAPYIYAVYFTLERSNALYIGQTLSRFGAVGRLAQHLSETSSATCRERIWSCYEIDDLDGLPVEFAAVRLNTRKSFLEDAPDYREAVESLVHERLLNAFHDRKIAACLISRYRLNAYCRLGYVSDEAARVCQNILGWLDTVRPAA